MPIRRHQRKPEKYGVSARDGGPNGTWLSSSSWDLDDGPNCEPHSDGKSSSRRTYPILRPRGRKFRDVCHYGADSQPAPSKHQYLPGHLRSFWTRSCVGLSAAASSCTGTTASRLLGIIWKTHGRRPRPPEIPPCWPPPRCKGPSGEVTRWTSRRSTPCELSSA